MSHRLPPLSALRVFESAARLLSFRQAADELHVTAAAVSQQIKSLETFLGVPLFHRERRQLTLTARGKALYPGIRDGFDRFAFAVASLQNSDQRSLTVTAPPSFAACWLVPRLSGFARAHPEIDLRVASDTANIDAEFSPLNGGPGDGGRGNEVATIAIRFGRGGYHGCRDTRILSPDYVLVCSPVLLASNPSRSGEFDLTTQVLLHDESIPVEKDRPDWAAWLRLAGVSGVDAARGPRFSNSIMALEAALAGQGVALLLEPLVASDLDAGRLVSPFSVRLPSSYAYYLSVPEAQAERPVVVAFERWLLTLAGASANREAPGTV